MRTSRLETRADHNRLLAEPSRLMILEALADGPRLITELAEVTGLHRNTLRAHLARLHDAGLVRSERRDPIGPGRPAIRYRLGDDLAAQGSEQQLLIKALVAMVARAYDHGADAMAAQEGERIGRELATRMAYPDVHEAIRQVSSVLRRLAFSPRVEREGRDSQIILHSCPFDVYAGDPRGPIICSFHLGLIRGVVAGASPDANHVVRLLPHVEPGLCRAEISFS
jgi:predicted ArsR family transcriptional regulator